MRIKPILTLLAMVITMLLVAVTACSQPSHKAWVEVTCDEFYEQNHISQKLEVQAGETFAVKLCSNPTTGFEWLEEAQISNSAVVKQGSYEFIGPESEPSSAPRNSGAGSLDFQGAETRLKHNTLGVQQAVGKRREARVGVSCGSCR